MGESAGRRAALEAFRRAAVQEAHNLKRRPEDLWQQLFNRLQWKEGCEALERVLAPELERRVSDPPRPWARNFFPALESDAFVMALQGHTDAIRCCAFSPAGTRIVSGSDDKTLRLWDARTGDEVAVLSGHSDAILCCAFSPDGSHVLSGSRDKTLRLWDARSGDELYLCSLPASVRLVAADCGDARAYVCDSKGWIHHLEFFGAGWTSPPGAQQTLPTTRPTAPTPRGASEPDRPPHPGLPAPAVQPDDPCPCGSGKKYRHCHGTPVESAEHLVQDDLAIPTPLELVAATREEIGQLEDAGDLRGAIALAESLAEFSLTNGLDGEIRGLCLMDLGQLQQQAGDHCSAEDSFDRAAQAFRSAPAAPDHLLLGALRQRARSLRLLHDPRARFVEEEISRLASEPAASCPRCGGALSSDLPWCPACGHDVEG